MGAVFGMLDNASDALGSVGRYMSNLNKVEDASASSTSRGATSQDYTTGDRFGAQGSGVSGALLDGTMSLGKGIVGGVAGVVLKPIKGAQQDGVTGFVKGFQKGVLGVVTSTAGGALQFASKGVQGVSTAFKQVPLATLRRSCVCVYVWVWVCMTRTRPPIKTSDLVATFLRRPSDSGSNVALTSGGAHAHGRLQRGPHAPGTRRQRGRHSALLRSRYGIRPARAAPEHAGIPTIGRTPGGLSSPKARTRAQKALKVFKTQWNVDLPSALLPLSRALN